MTRPCNMRSYQRSPSVRARIRDILERHPPLAARLTAKQIARRLGQGAPSVRTTSGTCAPCAARLSASRGPFSGCSTKAEGEAGELRKSPSPKGDRVRVTMSGKFLPYRKW